MVFYFFLERYINEFFNTIFKISNTQYKVLKKNLNIWWSNVTKNSKKLKKI